MGPDKVLAVLHPPTTAHARIMEKARCGALFIGTGKVVAAYTGLADVGTATMTECVYDRQLDRRQRFEPGDHQRRYRVWKEHGSASYGPRVHPGRDCRHPK